MLVAMCTSATPEQQAKDDQTRLDQQRKNYPDRDSLEQEKAAAERARKEDMLKK